MRRIRITWWATGLAVLAAVAYNSWPLGFWLNPRVSYGGGLASELEGLRQPYNWVFVLLDVVTGALVMTAVVMLWHHHRSKLSRWTLACFALFGLLTIADALLPMPCEPSVAVCPSWTAQPMLIMHGIASIGSAVALFASGVLAWRMHHKRHSNWIMRGMIVLWAVSGIMSLVFFFTPGPGYLSQDYYLLLCGIWIALMPYMAYPPAKRRQPVPVTV